MHPGNVAGAAWVFAAAPSKAPFYVAGAVLAAWAVLLAAFGATHPEFPRSPRGRRLVVLTTALLVVATMTSATLTAGGEGQKARAAPAGARPAPSTVALTADPSGNPSYDVRHVTVRAGTDTVRLVNRSPVPHNLTIAQGSKVIAATKTVQGAAATTTAKLAPGHYVFYCSVDAHRQAGMAGTLTVG
jgi:plastocyanin